MNDKIIIPICAWCPDKEEQEAKVNTDIYVISHSICEQCIEKVREETKRILWIK